MVDLKVGYVNAWQNLNSICHWINERVKRSQEQIYAIRSRLEEINCEREFVDLVKACIMLFVFIRKNSKNPLFFTFSL